jgi:hypothetical protein
MTMKTAQLKRLVGKVAAVVREMNEANRRMIVLRSAQDRYLRNSNEGPATYQEFLARTSGQLLHEPPANRRGPQGSPR